MDYCRFLKYKFLYNLMPEVSKTQVGKLIDNDKFISHIDLELDKGNWITREYIVEILQKLGSDSISITRKRLNECGMDEYKIDKTISIRTKSNHYYKIANLLEGSKEA